MNNQFYDLNIETLDDGTIRLEQRDYCGESMILDLHPAQVAYIADSLTVNTPERIQAQPNGTAERIATLERRMCWMRDRFEECYAALGRHSSPGNSLAALKGLQNGLLGKSAQNSVATSMLAISHA